VNRVNARTIRLQPLEVERTDAWRTAPLVVALALVAFVVYAVWAMLQNGHYYAAPYLSPFYSPCLAATCAHVSLPLVGSWWTLSPALLVLWIPAGFRATCYYYRKAYYRSLFRSPAACAVPDASNRYSGESRFPLVLQNLHRYFFYLTLPVLAFLWWDALRAFRFGDGWGIGLGTVVLCANAALLTLYSLGCNSCRHACGGHLDSFRGAPIRAGAWKIVSRLNEKHREYAWLSLGSVVAADLYVRLLSMGVFADPRLF
jgi:hypothetical protein